MEPVEELVINLRGVLSMNGNGIERVGRIQLRVHDFEKSVDYYTNVLGLDITGRDETEFYESLG